MCLDQRNMKRKLIRFRAMKQAWVQITDPTEPQLPLLQNEDNHTHLPGQGEPRRGTWGRPLSRTIFPSFCAANPASYHGFWSGVQKIGLSDIHGGGPHLASPSKASPERMRRGNAHPEPPIPQHTPIPSGGGAWAESACKTGLSSSLGTMLPLCFAGCFLKEVWGQCHWQCHRSAHP